MSDIPFRIGSTTGILTIGSRTRAIVVDGKTHYFEMLRHCGLGYCNKRGDERNAPGVRHKFWKAVRWWQLQGERIAEDGTCVYEEVEE